MNCIGVTMLLFVCLSEIAKAAQLTRPRHVSAAELFNNNYIQEDSNNASGI